MLDKYLHRNLCTPYQSTTVQLLYRLIFRSSHVMQLSKIPNPNTIKCFSLLITGIICLCWIGGGLVGFLPLFGWNAGEGVPECSFTKVMDYNFLVFLYFATIVFPALLLAAFYAHIYNVILKQVPSAHLCFCSSLNDTMSYTNDVHFSLLHSYVKWYR